MELISSASQHKDILNKYIPASDRIYIAVAFLKVSGLNLIIDNLIKAAKRESDIQIICGLDFALTEPLALKTIWGLTSKYNNIKLYLASAKDNRVIFHPKFYLLNSDAQATIISGSANLTSGGLASNYECSLMVQQNTDSEIFSKSIHYFNSLKTKELSTKATLLQIKNYERFFEEQKQLRKNVKAKPDKIYQEFSFNYENLLVLYNNYKRTQDIDVAFNERMLEYGSAKKLLDEIADTAKLTRAKFIPIFERLVGGAGIKALWHSGSIYRKKKTVFDHAAEFQELVRYVRNNKDKHASEVFCQCKLLAEKIIGSGVNTITEIMMTYDHNRFANLNANPIDVLINEAGVNIKKHRNSYKGGDYEEYCELVTEISEVLGLRNMLEADSFFNEIYWGFLK
jgi:HKD family nuclease